MLVCRSIFHRSRKTHRQTVSASAVNLLRQKRKKRTLAETLRKTTMDAEPEIEHAGLAFKSLAWKHFGFVKSDKCNANASIANQYY